MAQTTGAAMALCDTDQGTVATTNNDRVWTQWTIMTDGQANTVAWEGWCNSGDDNGGTATIQVSHTQTEGDRTWYYWCDVTNGSITNNNGTVSAQDVMWRRWNTDLDGNLVIDQIPELTEEERARRAEVQAEATKRHEEAKARAKELLREVLSPEQREAYDTGKPIPVRSESGKEYEISHGTAGNVVRLDDRRKPVERYCIHPREYSPVEDVMLTQLCWLRWCEEDFLRTANATPVREAA